MSRVKDIPKVRLHTSEKKQFGCAIGLLSIERKTPADLGAYLWSNCRIHTTTTVIENISGVRVTPNVYTSIKNLDRLLEGIAKFATG